MGYCFQFQSLQKWRKCNCRRVQVQRVVTDDLVLFRKTTVVWKSDVDWHSASSFVLTFVSDKELEEKTRTQNTYSEAKMSIYIAFGYKEASSSYILKSMLQFCCTWTVRSEQFFELYSKFHRLSSTSLRIRHLNWKRGR